MHDADIWQAAKRLIDQHGDEAALRAADQLMEEGDMDGATVWLRIVAAIEELRQGRREGGRRPLVPVT
jgi:hypothetical protein